MIMTTSPMLHTSTPPSGNSPSLRASGIKGNMTPMSLPSTSPSAAYQQPSSAPRSFARAPQARPYGSPLLSRNKNNVKEPHGDTKKFGELVAHMVEERTKEARRGGGSIEEAQALQARESRSVGGSLSGSLEKDRAELIVDVPVWSPGCFQDLSTLHALRDTTLAHTHSLLSYLQQTHSLASSYRLLARSTVGATRQPVGWGCIRLAPSNSSPVVPQKELKPLVRRSSTSISGGSHTRRRSSAPVSPISPTKEKRPTVYAPPTAIAGSEHAIVDEDDDDVEVKLKGGYISGSGSDAEEEETADEIIMKEVERRRAKEGSAFLMTVFGQPALILT